MGPPLLRFTPSRSAARFRLMGTSAGGGASAGVARSRPKYRSLALAGASGARLHVRQEVQRALVVGLRGCSGVQARRELRPHVLRAGRCQGLRT